MCAESELVRSVSLEALKNWLAVEGSDVEKWLRRAMRRRHVELLAAQGSRLQVAQRVLGVAVLLGRLRHLLAGAGAPRPGAEELLELYVRRELGGEGHALGAAEVLVQRAVVAPLCGGERCLAERLKAIWSLPRWLAEMWLERFGLEAFRLGKAMSLPARLTLRVNRLLTERC